jgi:hypothetical protein
MTISRVSRTGKPWKNKGKSEIQGSLHCGGKSAAFGRDDVCGWVERGNCKSRSPFGDDKQNSGNDDGNGSLGAGWEDGCAALAQADAWVVGAFAGASEDDFVAVVEEGAGFAGGELDGISSVTGEFQETASGCFGGAGDGSGGEDVSGLEVAAVACVMSDELGWGPIKVARTAFA